MKKTLIPAVLATVALAILAAGGCGIVGSGIARLTTDFKELPADNRIAYEDGAEPLAQAASRYLPQAIAAVEMKQYGSFKEPVKIYAFATPQSFSKFSGVSDVPLGAGVKNEVYLSGKLSQSMDNVQGILTHELSHTQLSQTLGVIQFNRTLPRWFREGLAIYVADGGGAKWASEAETIEKFLAGRHFLPETEGTLLNLRLPANGEMEPRIFYRQSGMFVEFLALNSPVQFEKMMRGLQEGKAFEAQFIKAFEKSVDEALQIFIKSLQKA